jgi:hypothetical protein
MLGTGYNPTPRLVGPGRTFAPQTVTARLASNTAEDAIQLAINAANAGDLVVVYPGGVANGAAPSIAEARNNPRGAYFENLIVNKPVKLQGFGPGGIYPDGTSVPGSVVDGSSFSGDSPMAAAWFTTLLSPQYATWAGNQNINDGAVITAFAASTNTFPLAPTVAQRGSIDGLDLRGGDQQGFPGNINSIAGMPTGLPAGIVTQGGAIFANAYVRGLQITNNVVENNGGGYGTIRIGTPDLPAPNNHNENVRIANNRIIHNAGTNLAGGVGLYEGSDGYEVAGNDLCGNFSAEYGGAMSVYGLSPNGRIHDNRIYFNASYDEGGGVMVAGTLPADPAVASTGAGATDIYNNLIQGNLGNDDGGGLRFLQAGTAPMNVYNNIIANNVSTHEGGGVGINDTTDVRFYNNTVMKNMTTATAVTSNGQPAPAGLSTSRLSTVLGGGPTNVTVFNDVFWDNRAGTRAGATVTGLGLGGVTDINRWDLGAADASGLLTPTNSVLQTVMGTTDEQLGRSPGRVDVRHVGGLQRVARQPRLRRGTARRGRRAADPARQLPPGLQRVARLQPGRGAEGPGGRAGLRHRQPGATGARRVRRRGRRVR